MVEANFFRWLRDIKCVKDFQFGDGGIIVTSMEPTIDPVSLDDLNALFDRYRLSKLCLKNLMTDETPDWLRERIFSDSRT